MGIKESFMQAAREMSGFGKDRPGEGEGGTVEGLRKAISDSQEAEEREISFTPPEKPAPNWDVPDWDGAEIGTVRPMSQPTQNAFQESEELESEAPLQDNPPVELFGGTPQHAANAQAAAGQAAQVGQSPFGPHSQGTRPEKGNRPPRRRFTDLPPGQRPATPPVNTMPTPGRRAGDRQAPPPPPQPQPSQQQQHRQPEQQQQSYYSSRNTQANVGITGTPIMPHTPPAPTPVQRSYAGMDDSELTIISRHTVIDGNIRSFADMSIDGDIKGDIETTKNIDLNGKVVGNISCNNAMMHTSQIQGNVRMKGNISMKRDTLLIGDLMSTYAEVNGKVKGNLDVVGKADLRGDAVVFGDISAATITVEDGAIIQGYVSTTFLNKDESRNLFPDMVTINDNVEVAY